MSVQIKHCLTIVCDGCGKGAEEFDDEFGEPHFATLEEAIERLAGDDQMEDANYAYQWLMTPSEHICPWCRARRACATVGHDWGDWWGVRRGGLLISQRSCQRCPEHQISPKATDREVGQ